MLHLETFKIKISTTKNGGFFININGTKIPFDYSANADYMIQAQNYLTSKNYHVVGVDNINKIIVASIEKYDIKRVYQFSELSEKVKLKVIEQFQNNNYDCLDSTNDYLIEILNCLGFDDVDLNYSASYSQSDYFRFTGTFKHTDLSEMKIEYEKNDDVLNVINIVESLPDISFNRSNGNDIEILSDYWLDTQENLDTIRTVLNAIDNLIKITVYNEIDYQSQDSTIIETIEANEYEFYENGEII